LVAIDQTIWISKMNHEENKTFELIPLEEHEQAWGVRILEGVYNETVLKFGEISFNEEDGNEDEASMSFSFEIISSPDTELTTEDEDLQQFSGKLLEDIIALAIEREELEAIERESQPRTDNPSEHSD
jgi:hypothetical protein